MRIEFGVSCRNNAVNLFVSIVREFLVSFSSRLFIRPINGKVQHGLLLSVESVNGFYVSHGTAREPPRSPFRTYVRTTSRFKLAWNTTAETDGELMHLTISARGIETQGMIVSGHGLSNPAGGYRTTRRTCSP